MTSRRKPLTREGAMKKELISLSVAREAEESRGSLVSYLKAACIPWNRNLKICKYIQKIWRIYCLYT